MGIKLVLSYRIVLVLSYRIILVLSYTKDRKQLVIMLAFCL